MSRLLLALVMAAVLLGPLAACGRKGDPFVPKGETNTINQKYPNKFPDPNEQNDQSGQNNQNNKKVQ